METTQMCRCCATEGSFKDIKNPYYWMGEEEVYGDMLRECFDVKMSSPEHGGICEVCITQLRNAVNFRKQVITTEERFKKLLDDIKFKATIVKEEISADDEDKFESEDNGNQDDDEDYVPDYDIPIKTETLEVKPKKRASTAKATTSKGKRSKKSEEKSDTSERAKWTIEKKQKQEAIVLLLRCSNATPVLKCKGLFYFCCFCNAQFLNTEKLKYHTIEAHREDLHKMVYSTREYIVKLDITELACNLCSIPLPTIQNLIQHLIQEHDQKIAAVDISKSLIPFKFDGMFRCGFEACNAAFNTFQGVTKHMNTHIPNYICEICHNTYTQKSVYNLHVKGHTLPKKKTTRVKQIKCPHCDMISKHSHAHAIHMKEEHGLGTVFKCTSCEREFQSSMHLRVHIKRDHLMERNHQCSYCEKSFYYRTKLNNHLTIHTGERRFSCNVCDKKFKTKYNLTVHNRIHTNDKRYKCRICDKAYAQRSWVTAHMKSKHGEEPIVE